MPRITGKLGSVALTGHDSDNPIGDIFNWTLEFNIRAEPCGVKGSIAEEYSLGEFTGRITAERFSSDASGDSILADTLLDVAATAGNQEGGAATSVAGGKGGGASVTYVLEQIDGVAAGAKVTGKGYVVSGGLNAPRAMANDRFEILLASLPTLT